MSKPAKPEKIEAAFFDLDNTLLRGASSFLFAKAAFERNFIKRRELWRFAWQQLKFITRGESAKMLAHIEDRALSLVVGHDAAEMESMVGITWNDYVKAKMWPETVRIAQEHIKNGREVWIVTAAPVQMGQYIAKDRCSRHHPRSQGRPAYRRIRWSPTSRRRQGCCHQGFG